MGAAAFYQLTPFRGWLSSWELEEVEMVGHDDKFVEQ